MKCNNCKRRTAQYEVIRQQDQAHYLCGYCYRKWYERIGELDVFYKLTIVRRLDKNGE